MTEDEYTPRFCAKGHKKVKRTDKSGWVCPVCRGSARTARSKARAALKKKKIENGTWLPLDEYRAKKYGEQNNES